MEQFEQYKYLIIPALVWFGIQLFKVIYDYYETKKWNWTRMFGTGGMPSSHSAVVACLTTMIGKNQGVTSVSFAISFFLATIVMQDAMGVRRSVGEHAKILNDILNDRKKTGVQKLQEMTGHTPVQVVAGAIIGFLVGMFF